MYWAADFSMSFLVPTLSKAISMRASPPMGGDALIEIAFDSVGTKKLMLKSAAQYMSRDEG